MKDIMQKYSKVFIPIAILLLIVGCVGGYIIGHNNQPHNGSNGNGASTQPNGEQSNNPNQNTNNNSNENAQVTLNDGRTLKVGDEVSVERSNYYEGGTEIIGKIVKVYEETGHVLIGARLGVVEFNYRYVVDVKAERIDGGHDTEVNKAFTDTVRAVVTKNQEGKEFLHFIRDLDDEATISAPYLKWPHIQIDAMKNYDNRKFYQKNIGDDGNFHFDASTPDYIIQFDKSAV